MMSEVAVEEISALTAIFCEKDEFELLGQSGDTLNYVTVTCNTILLYYLSQYLTLTGVLIMQN